MILTTTRKLERDLERATSYEEWKAAAQAYDAHTGLDRWKIMDQSRRYDYVSIRVRLDRLRAMRARHDNRGLLFNLNEGIHGNMGGMGRSSLYERAKFGTKQLIVDYVSIRVRLDRLRAMRARHDNRGLLFNLNEGIHGNMGGMGRSSLYERAKFGTKQLIVDYVDEIVESLEHLASPDVAEISREEKLDFFHRADHCFGRSAFMMSGSGSLFYFHIGVVRSLLKEGLLPTILSGSSGGSFVGSLLSTYSDPDLIDLLDPDYLVNKVEEIVGDMKKGSRYSPSVMPIDGIRRVIDRMIPDLTFQEALERTGRHLNISIAAVETHQKSRLLNAIASPNVYIREAVLASGAVPGVYPPVTLAAKNHLGEKQAYLPSRKWVDGSVSDDMPAKRLARMYGVNHYIVSQTNPHVLPFVADGKRKQDTLSVLKDATTKTARAWVNAGAITLEKPLSITPALSRMTNLWLSVINQDYIGDINILPSKRYFNPMRLLAFLTEQEIRELVTAGERAAWPKIEMIRVQTKISRTLDRILANWQHDHVMHVKGALRKRPR